MDGFGCCQVQASVVGGVRRILQEEVDDLFGQVPAIAIEAPDAVAKTNTHHGARSPTEGTAGAVDVCDYRLR